MNALWGEIEMWRDLLADREVLSLYCGGGTPTILPPAELQKLARLAGKNRCFEANPATLIGAGGQGKLEALAGEGVERLSIGVQSFDNRLLRAIGRGNYTGKEAEEVVRAAKARFKIVNVDMMSDLPGQGLEDIEADLGTIERVMPDSVTWYTMRVGPGCWLYNRGERVSEEEGLIARIMIVERLKELGYMQTSGDRFCLGVEAKDNFKAVRSSTHAPMLGVGASAYSSLGRIRFRNTTDTCTYIERVNSGNFPVSSSREYTPEEEVAAEFVLGLREGLELSGWGRRLLFGNWWDRLTASLEQPSMYPLLIHEWGYRKLVGQLIKHRLLELGGNTLQFTDKGRLFENEILRKFYSPMIDAEARVRRFLAAIKRFWWDFCKEPIRVRA